VKLFLACVLVGCAIAHETEYYNLENDIAAPPGETYGDVEMLQEDAGSKMKEDVVYRISWNTQYDTDSTKTGSKGAFKITIDGPDGATTGEKDLVSHPGYNCGAASDPACFPDITGKVLADDDASMDCGCDPSNEAYDEVAAKWHPAGAGSVEHFYLKAVDVVTISKVTITGDAASSDSWTPGFLKINMNDMQSGLGNGIFYMDIGKKINKEKPYIAEIGQTDTNGDKATMARKSTHNYGILQCEAAACEEKMDAKMKMSGMEAKKETKK
jgi:hypothetical protein